MSFDIVFVSGAAALVLGLSALWYIAKRRKYLLALGGVLFLSLVAAFQVPLIGPPPLTELYYLRVRGAYWAMLVGWAASAAILFLHSIENIRKPEVPSHPVLTVIFSLLYAICFPVIIFFLLILKAWH